MNKYDIYYGLPPIVWLLGIGYTGLMLALALYSQYIGLMLVLLYVFFNGKRHGNLWRPSNQPTCGVETVDGQKEEGI